MHKIPAAATVYGGLRFISLPLSSYSGRIAKPLPRTVQSCNYAGDATVPVELSADANEAVWLCANLKPAEFYVPKAENPR